MRVATWNVNSVRQRVPRLLPWLDERQPDVVCLQEIKVTAEAFAELLGSELTARGYEYAAHGQSQWNGVALLSRAGLDDVRAGLPDEPGFPEPEARAISASCGGIRVHSVYVPNGRSPGSDHYQYKLAWLAALRAAVAAGPADALVCGDMNIAPADADVFDPAAYLGQTHVTPPERAALAELESVGLHDVLRDRWPDSRVFTYWDYRAGMFHQDLGMRIDLILASATAAPRVRAAWVDRKARKGTAPSDHAPVIADLDEAPDGDIGPVVPPPSARPAGRGPARLPQSRQALPPARLPEPLPSPVERRWYWSGRIVFRYELGMPDTTIPAAEGTPLKAYLAVPAEAGPRPGVVVIQDALGLTRPIREHVDRLASYGYLAVAPDLYARGGMLRCVRATMRSLFSGQGQAFEDIERSRRWLLGRDDCSGRVGVIGFCMGGGFALMTANRGFDVSAPNYGHLPKNLDSALSSACPVVASYGARDRTLKGTAAKLEAALTERGIPHDVKEYPRAGHSFLEQFPVGPLAPVLRVAGLGYEAASADDAWRRIRAFFDEHLAVGERPETG